MSPCSDREVIAAPAQIESSVSVLNDRHQQAKQVERNVLTYCAHPQISATSCSENRPRNDLSNDTSNTKALVRIAAAISLAVPVITSSNDNPKICRRGQRQYNAKQR